MEISEIDKNFAPPLFCDDGVAYYDIKNAPFEISGLPEYEKTGLFNRLPDEMVNGDELFWGVKSLRHCSTGGQIRFITDSPVISAKYVETGIYPYPHFALTGLAGMDLYVGHGSEKIYKGNLLPGENDKEACASFNIGEGLHEITINMPTYAGLVSMNIGIKEGFKLLPPEPFSRKKPICFYGSSITQGGCCAHPGTAYPTIVGRMFDVPTVNLGFSGSCKGEQCIARYIGTLDISAMIYDYDHNTPDIEHLRNTHFACYETMRKAHPDIPFVILSKPDYRGDDTEDAERRRIIIETYEKAKKRGDKVAFVDGKYVFDGPFKDGCTTDGCHPNDLGFSRMALKVIDALKSLGY